MSDNEFSRRDFTKVTGTGMAGFVLGGKVKEAAASEVGGRDASFFKTGTAGFNRADGRGDDQRMDA